MTPTLESWNNNPLDIGPMYPLVGTEVAMVLACFAFCIVFMVWKFRTEGDKYRKQTARLHDSLARAESMAAGAANHQNAREDEQREE